VERFNDIFIFYVDNAKRSVSALLQGERGNISKYECQCQLISGSIELQKRRRLNGRKCAVAKFPEISVSRFSFF
jgi:hypothetical protein